MEKTIGERRVRIDFNPSNTDAVFQAKSKVAELINQCHAVADEGDAEAVRTAMKAAEEFESAGHWLVKALTAGK